jgi:hypothetical protein
LKSKTGPGAEDEGKRASTEVPALQGLFKIHKEQLAFRPVLRAAAGPLVESERWAGHKLSEIMGGTEELGKSSAKATERCKSAFQGM